MKRKLGGKKLKPILAVMLGLVTVFTAAAIVAQQTAAAPGYIELTGGLSFGATTITGSVGRTVVNNHPYVAAVSGTGGWTSTGFKLGTVYDYRAVFDSPVGDGLVGPSFFAGQNTGHAGVELKAPQYVTRIGFQARAGYPLARLNGATFQGSNDGVSYTTLYTFNVTGTSFVYKTGSDGLRTGTAYKYFRIMGSTGLQAEINILELKLYADSNPAATTATATSTAAITSTSAATSSTGSTMPGYTELTGSLQFGGTGTAFGGTGTNGSGGRTAVSNHPYVAAVCGTGGWTSGGGYTYNAVDYRGAFDSPKGDGLAGPSYFDGAKTGYAAVEFKTPQYVDMIAYQARQNANRLNGAYFQGSNDNITYVSLFTINGASTTGFTYRTGANGLITNRAYKFYRIVGHNGMADVLNIAELKLYTTRPVSAGTGYGTGFYRVAPPAGTNVNGMFNFVRSAIQDSVYDNVLILTPEDEWLTGGAWAKQKIDLTKPFTIESYIHLYHAQGFVSNTEMKNFGGDGLADGITFTLQNDNASAIGNNDVRSPGGLLGVYSGLPARGYVRNALSIELDTRYNPPTDAITGIADPVNGNCAHIAVLTPKSGKMVAADHRNVDWFTKEAKWYPFNISWTPAGAGGVLSYQFNGKSYSYTVSSCAAQFGGTSVWWGFTAATGDGTGVQAVALKTIPNATVTLSYDANGGTGAPPAQTVPVNTNATISSTIPVRTGYNFAGWALTPGATSPQYQPGGTIYMDSNKTLYAVWQVANVTLSYDANGGTGAPPAQTVPINTNTTVSSTIPIRGGYSFEGWALTPGATTPQYQPGDTIFMDNSKVLFAVWKINPQAKVVTGDWISYGNYIALVQNNTYENIPGTVAETGVLYSKSSSMAGALKAQGSIGTPFIVYLVNLSNGTWYCQAYVINGSGDIYYGEIKQAAYP